MTAMVEIDRLVKTFGTFAAVKGISLSVSKGEVLGFLGPNGAGKTTTMRMISGFLTPTSGTARVCGHDVVTNPTAVKRTMGYMPEGAPAYEDMSVRAFLAFIAAVRGLDGEAATKAIERAVERVKLGDVMDRPIDVLSKGYKRRVGMAQAILHDPPVLILDEPTDGLDPNQKHHVRSLIKDMASEKAIIISTHILEEVEAVCTRAVIIGQGQLLADGTSDDLLAKLPDYHAVAVTVPATQVEATVAALRSVPNVAYVSSHATGASTVTVRAVPKQNTPLLSSAAEALQRHGIVASEIYQDRGNLDDVFRLITTGAVQSAA